MSTKATFYVDESLLKAFKVKAAHSYRSLSELVNEAMRESLREDEEDIRDIKKRAKEPSVSFDSVLKELKRAGRI
jgi:Arc/MetJ-type ribon-helix-helix transcriptional regulator